MAVDPDRAAELIERLLSRFRGATLEMLEQVMLPLQIPLSEVERQIQRHGSGYCAGFRIEAGDENPAIMRGRSGKVVPREAVSGGTAWKELIKARIHEAGHRWATGELHGGSKEELCSRLAKVEIGDILEIDRFGITAKLESALTEAALVEHGRALGYSATRMPEDVARHLGEYWHFDFLFRKNGVSKRVECKSMWGTDTRYARLIHSKGANYQTSSCKFATQDIFAVNLWLRTGVITDFAFARSVLRDTDHPYGLPCATGKGGTLLPDYVNQNPVLNIGDGIWFDNIDAVWNLL